MRPLDKYPILASILKPLHGHQRKTVGLVVAAIVHCKVAQSLAVANQLVKWLQIQLGSALERFYRLLRNPRLDDLSITREMLRMVQKAVGKVVLVAIDWTEWHEPVRMLIASAICGKRAIPVQAQAFKKQRMKRSQNIWENNFPRLLAAAAREAMVHMTILCDRGFRRVSWLNLLVQQGLDFVVRLKDDVHVHLPGLSRTVALSAVGLRPGKVVDLGWVTLRRDGATEVRVVGVWERGAREPWWLATSYRKKSVKNLVAYFDRRMGIEQQIRDTKGCRFGVKLYWSQFKNPDHLARVMLLVGMAVMIWTAAGVAAAQRWPSLLLPHKTKGPRQSYVTIGMAHLEELHRLRATAETIANLLPQPEQRRFGWIGKATRRLPLRRGARKK